MFKITTHITDKTGSHEIEIGTANSREAAQEKIDSHFRYLQYGGADSIDYEMLNNVQVTDVTPPAPRWHGESATARQIEYLRDLGVSIPSALTKKQASDLIEQNKIDRTQYDHTACHECGGNVRNGRCVVCGGTDMVW